MHELQELNMQGKTHLAVGSALALALLPPTGMHTLIIGTGAAALGSVVSDIDSGHSGAGQDAARVMAVSAIITILTVAADLTFHTGIIDGIRQRLSMNLNLAAGIGFVLILLLGILLPHRSFMHSLTGGALLCVCLWKLVPEAWMYFAVGFGSHLLLDLTNQRGEQLFFPYRRRYSLGWFKSNGFVNRLLLTAGTVLLVILLYRYASPYIKDAAQGIGEAAGNVQQELQDAARNAGETLRSGWDHLTG